MNQDVITPAAKVAPRPPVALDVPTLLEELGSCRAPGERMRFFRAEGAFRALMDASWPDVVSTAIPAAFHEALVLAAADRVHGSEATNAGCYAFTKLYEHADEATLRALPQAVLDVFVDVAVNKNVPHGANNRDMIHAFFLARSLSVRALRDAAKTFEATQSALADAAAFLEATTPESKDLWLSLDGIKKDERARYITLRDAFLPMLEILRNEWPKHEANGYRLLRLLQHLGPFPAEWKDGFTFLSTTKRDARLKKLANLCLNATTTTTTG